MKGWVIGIAVLALVGFLVWANWPKKGVINPAWQMDYDANINAGYSEAEAAEMASKVYPKYVYDKK